MTNMAVKNNPKETEVFESLLLLVDVQNLFYSARDSYGLAARIDFRKLKELALKGRSFRHIISYAYLAALPKEIPDTFISALRKLSYEVKIADIRVHERGQMSATNIDVMLASDAQNLKVLGREPTVVVVASGDADYTPVYRILRERGVRVEVLSFQSSLATSIYDESDEIRFLTRDHLYGEKTTND